MGISAPPHGLQDALVDEVGSLVAGNSLDDAHHLLCGIEETGLGILLLASGAFPGSSP